MIFRKPATTGDRKRSNYPLPEKTIQLDKPWMVRFDKNLRGPVQPVKIETLSDWSKSSNDTIKYYSGTAYYHNTFKIDKLVKGANYVVDLGLVRAVAKVFVNGKEMGGAWTPSYHVDITNALKPNENKLEIKVVNTWVNRLLGDSMLPADQRKTTVLYGPDPKNGLESSGCWVRLKST